LNFDSEDLKALLKWGFHIFNWTYMILFTLLDVWPGWWVLLVLYPSFLILVLSMQRSKRKKEDSG